MKTSLQWFISGVGSIAVALPAFGHFGARPQNQSDSDALRGDWEMVGSDLRVALEHEQAKESGGKKVK